MRKLLKIMQRGVWAHFEEPSSARRLILMRAYASERDIGEHSSPEEIRLSSRHFRGEGLDERQICVVIPELVGVFLILVVTAGPSLPRSPSSGDGPDSGVTRAEPTPGRCAEDTVPG